MRSVIDLKVGFAPDRWRSKSVSFQVEGKSSKGLTS